MRVGKGIYPGTFTMRQEMATQHPSPPGLRSIVALVLAVGLLTAAPAIADHTACQTVAAKHLETLGIDAEDVIDIAMIHILGNPEMGSIIEMQAWTILKSCPGNLVIRLTPFCRVKDVYSRGGCRFDKIRHF